MSIRRSDVQVRRNFKGLDDFVADILSKYMDSFDLYDPEVNCVVDCYYDVTAMIKLSLSMELVIKGEEVSVEIEAPLSYSINDKDIEPSLHINGRDVSRSFDPEIDEDGDIEENLTAVGEAMSEDLLSIIDDELS